MMAAICGGLEEGVTGGGQVGCPRGLTAVPTRTDTHHLPGIPHAPGEGRTRQRQVEQGFTQHRQNIFDILPALKSGDSSRETLMPECKNGHPV